jgi:hypothetical protein
MPNKGNVLNQAMLDESSKIVSGALPLSARIARRAMAV